MKAFRPVKISTLRKICCLACSLGLFALPSFALDESHADKLKLQVLPPPGPQSSAESPFAELFATSLCKAIIHYGPNHSCELRDHLLELG
jgi:hypothetical protein